MSDACFQNWSVQKLKTALRKRSPTTHGRKSDLVESELTNGSTSTVTGSTLNAALGLDTLKSQQEHYDCVKSGTKRKEPSPQVMEKMVHGTQNEIHAVATAVSKEEGRIKTESNGVCIVVSPDGSFVEEETETTTMAVEIKCPFPAQPGTYKPPIYHKVPKYYVPQILSEMYALNVESLLFLCYSQESTSAMHAHFDADLWSMILKQLEAVYETGVRPVRKSNQIVHLKEKISAYIDKHVKFIGEFVSVKGEQCPGKTSHIDEPFCTHKKAKHEVSTL
ncbi:hypothetical protein KP79_PYT22951 [Mizuhopecten yessoensis]|uniref:YqaJ viral recombinase domain-containing protein n=1 Tax=Mizuhopecten yessoensis TaxID=6573 RepID=A0A210PSE8_MIZYE|nr:hypothetical protein KP79_PYT22951 [Mizuhopecten yessoensis]